MSPSPRSRNSASHRHVMSAVWRTTALSLVLLATAEAGVADDLLSGLAKPHEGRSMRATSTFRQGKDGKYDPKARPEGRQGGGVEPGQLPRGAGRDARADGREGAGGDHAHLAHVPRAGAAGLGEARLGQPSGDAAAHLLGRAGTARRRGARGRLLRQLLRPAQRGREPAGDRRGCRLLQLFLAHAVSQVGPGRDRQPEREADQPALLQHRLDQEARHRRGHALLPCAVPPGIPGAAGTDYVVLETKGKGHYVGTVLAVRTRSPAWFGEGDEKISIDGEAKPSIWGTGTEDYFLSAWGLKKTRTPYFGVPYFDQWGIVGGHTSAYRWHLADPIVFNTGIKVAFEHFGWISPDENPDNKSTSWNEREDDYASVAFWYQTGEPTFTARAPHARERKLPSLDRVIAYARDHADPAHHGQGAAVSQQLALYDGPQLLYKPESAEGRVDRDPVRGQDEGAAPAAAQPDEVVRLRPVPGLAERDQARRADRPLQRRGRERGGPPAGLLAGAGSLHAPAGVHRQESPVRRPFPGHRVGAPPRAPAPAWPEYGHDKDKDWKQKAELYR